MLLLLMASVEEEEEEGPKIRTLPRRSPPQAQEWRRRGRRERRVAKVLAGQLEARSLAGEHEEERLVSTGGWRW